MTANALLEYQITQAGKQLAACLDGMPEEGFHAKCAAHAMSPLESLEHLCEAYQALIAALKGEKHAWGTFTIPDKSPDNVKKVFLELRAQAVAGVLASTDEASLKEGCDFVVAHDNYHIGQLVLSRLQVQPDWDSYAIYA